MYRLGSFLIISMIILLGRDAVYSQTWQEQMNKADSLAGDFELDSAITLGRYALHQAEEQLGAEDTLIARILDKIGKYYYYNSQPDSAREMWNRSYSIRIKKLGRGNKDLAGSIFNLGFIANQMNEYDKAESLYVEAIASMTEAVGPDDPLVAHFLNSLGLFYYDMNRFLDAESTYKRALAILQKSGDVTDRFVYVVNNLGLLYWDLGRLDEAREYFLQAADAALQLRGRLSANLASIYHNLAMVNADEGRLADALHYGEEALDIRLNTYGDKHPVVGHSLNNIASIKVDQGDYEGAEKMFLQAYELFNTGNEATKLDVANTLESLGLLYRTMGRLPEAEKALSDALAIYESTFEEPNSSIAETWCGLADVAVAASHYAKAESLYVKSLALQKELYGDVHPQVAFTLRDLAVCYWKTGRLEMADSSFADAKAILETLFGANHIELARILESQSIMNRGRGDFGLAFSQADSAFNIRYDNYMSNNYVLTERELLKYAGLSRETAYLLASAYADLDQPDSEQTERVARALITTKGLVTLNVKTATEHLLETNDAATRAAFDSLRTAKSQIAKEFTSSPDAESNLSPNTRDSLQALANKLEQRLARLNTAFEENRGARLDEISMLARAIPVDACLIEYIKYNHTPADGGEQAQSYLVVTVNHDAGISLINLGPADVIDKQVDVYRTHMISMSKSNHLPSNEDTRVYSGIAKHLYKSLISPVGDSLDTYDQLLISPVSYLNLVSFASLIDENDRYLIESARIHYLSAGRDILAALHSTKAKEGVLAVGDPDFDATVEERRNARGGEPVAAPDESPEFVTRSLQLSCGDLANLNVNRLPGTAREIQLLVSGLSPDEANNASVLLGAAASEGRFKSEAPRKRIIHIATHGYYLNGLCSDETTGRDEEKTFITNPLLLSGLLLAGSNLHGKGADSAGLDDGYLSAYEIANMDLRGTDLIMLSACETGLGKLEEGEGVYGLRRAFQVSGARAVVSSLWAVSDESTAELMGVIYEDRATMITDRLRDSQLKRITSLRKAGLPDHPYNWAGFIAIGDWK